MENRNELKFIETHINELLANGIFPGFYINTAQLNVDQMILINSIGEILIYHYDKSYYTLNMLNIIIENACNNRWWIEWRRSRNNTNELIMDIYEESELVDEFKKWIIDAYHVINKGTIECLDR